MEREIMDYVQYNVRVCDKMPTNLSVQYNIHKVISRQHSLPALLAISSDVVNLP